MDVILYVVLAVARYHRGWNLCIQHDRRYLLFVVKSYIVSGYSVAESAIVPLYSLYMVLWSATFLKLWRRKATALAYDWGTWDNTKTESVRPDFKGRLLSFPFQTSSRKGSFAKVQLPEEMSFTTQTMPEL